MSFDPAKKLNIPSLIHPSEWDGDTFKEFRQKVDQARIVIFTVLPGVDDPDDPDTMVLKSLWGEVLVTRVKDLIGNPEQERGVGGFDQLQSFFAQPQTAYIVERVDRTLGWMTRMGLVLDEAAVTGLETWYLLGQGFCPSVALVMPELWGRLTASFRGSASYGWAWNQHKKEESSDLAPDQTCLAFAIGNALATLSLDGIVARIDPEDTRSFGELGSIILQSEQEGILEGEETLAMRALRLGTEESGDDTYRDEAVLTVTWGNAQVAYREPLGRICRKETVSLRDEGERAVMTRKREVITDWLTWEESLSCITLLGPEHQKPMRGESITLPDRPAAGILRQFDPEKLRRANERLGLDPDDLDYARERFAGLKVTEGKKREVGRTPSPPPQPNFDVHGLWAEERHKQNGGRHRGPPRLRWNPPVKREPLKKRHRDVEGQVEAWGECEEREESRQNRPPPSKKSRETGGPDPGEGELPRTTARGSGHTWSRRRGGRVPGQSLPRSSMSHRGRGYGLGPRRGGGQVRNHDRGNVRRSGGRMRRGN